MELSRRKMLLGGGALGAAGALAMASPAGARSLWTWKPSGSVAGAGAGEDPRWVWDELAERTREESTLRGDVDAHHPVTAAIKQLTPGGAPEWLVAAIARDLP